jgi:hypothetical protein
MNTTILTVFEQWWEYILMHHYDIIIQGEGAFCLEPIVTEALFDSDEVSFLFIFTY